MAPSFSFPVADTTKKRGRGRPPGKKSAKAKAADTARRNHEAQEKKRQKIAEEKQKAGLSSFLATGKTKQAPTLPDDDDATVNQDADAAGPIEYAPVQLQQEQEQLPQSLSTSKAILEPPAADDADRPQGKHGAASQEEADSPQENEPSILENVDLESAVADATMEDRSSQQAPCSERREYNPPPADGDSGEDDADWGDFPDMDDVPDNLFDDADGKGGGPMDEYVKAVHKQLKDENNERDTSMVRKWLTQLAEDNRWWLPAVRTKYICRQLGIIFMKAHTTRTFSCGCRTVVLDNSNAQTMDATTTAQAMGFVGKTSICRAK